MTIELGLHRDPSHVNYNEQQREIRNRAFWVAHMLEITVSFNQGRPPSISNRKIDAPFPKETPATIMPIYLMRYRLIQSQVIEEIYPVGDNRSCSQDGASFIINNIQSQLDNLNAMLPEFYSRADTPYHQEQVYDLVEIQSADICRVWNRPYYVTTGTIHSPTPINPRPTIESLEICLHCAGQYVGGFYHLFRNTNTPVTWAALHGTMLSSLAVFMIAQIETKQLFERSEPETLIERIADWSRKSAVILTIVNERLAGGTISGLEAHFEAMCKKTLKTLSTRHRETLVSWNGGTSTGADFETTTRLKEAKDALSIFLQNRSYETEWGAALDLPEDHWLYPTQLSYADAFELDPALEAGMFGDDLNMDPTTLWPSYQALGTEYKS
jgi:hypothetical protein